MKIGLTQTQRDELRAAHTILKANGFTDAMKQVGQALEEDEQRKVRTQRPTVGNTLSDASSRSDKYWLWSSDFSGAQYRHQNGQWWVRLLGDPGEAVGDGERWQECHPKHELIAGSGEKFIPIMYVGP